MTAPTPPLSAESIANVRAYVEAWAPYNGGRSLAQHGGKHLFLRDLREVLEALARVEVDEIGGEWVPRVRAEAAEARLAALRQAVEALAELQGVDPRWATQRLDYLADHIDPGADQ